MKKIGFVVPWYGDAIPGGAEEEARTLVKHLLAAGLDVEVLTTCVKEFSSDWNKNYHKPGVYEEAGVSIRRFPVRKRKTTQFDDVNRKLMNGIHPTTSEEKIFMEEMVNSPELYTYIGVHKKEYDLFVFIPYMFGTTYYGSLQCLDRAVMIPCFHEEAYLHMKLLRKVFEHVAGVVYNAEPEQTLANHVFDLKNVPQVVMGLGMDTNLTFDANRFQKKYGVTDPFILYAGRKDTGKNINTLIRYFDLYHRLHSGSRLKLVLIGGGTVEIPSDLREHVLDLGFVKVQDKYDALAAAMVLCQPSVHESFSIVIMESWLCGRPVLVHEDCEVTKSFAREACGGLYFRTFSEFNECIEFFLGQEELCRQMGESGRAYVQQHFAWDVIVERYICFFKQVIQKREQDNDAG